MTGHDNNIDNDIQSMFFRKYLNISFGHAPGCTNRGRASSMLPSVGTSVPH